MIQSEKYNQIDEKDSKPRNIIINTKRIKKVNLSSLMNDLYYIMKAKIVYTLIVYTFIFCIYHK